MKKITICLQIMLAPFFIVQAQTITTTGNLKTVRMEHESQLLANGNVLAFGGSNGDFAGTLVTHTSAELYNPATGTWTYTGSMNQKRSTFASAILPNGNVLAIGGDVDLWMETNTCEIYNVSSGTWSSAGNLILGRLGHKAVVLNNGKVLIGGGLPSGNTSELYDPATNTWTATGNMNQSRDLAMDMVVLNNGKVLATGGDGSLSTAEIYDPATGIWTSVSTNMIGSRYAHQSMLLNNGKVLIAGSSDFTHNVTAELFDPTSGTFTATGGMQQVRNYTPLVKLNNGNVLVFGVGDFFNPFNTQCVEVFNAATGTWSSATYSITGSHYYTAHKLLTGKILILGGTQVLGGIANCWLIDDNTVISVDELANNKNITMFPNPFSSHTTLQTEQPLNNATLSVYNAFGQKVKQLENISGQSITLYRDDLTAGVYFIQLIEENKITKAGKLIIAD